MARQLEARPDAVHHVPEPVDPEAATLPVRVREHGLGVAIRRARERHLEGSLGALPAGSPGDSGRLQRGYESDRPGRA